MIDAIIFDLDGTLADTMDDLKTAMNSMLTKLGYKNRTKAELLTFINNGAREFVRRSLPESVQGIDFIIESALETYSDEYKKCYCSKTHAFDGINDMLTELNLMGVKLAVLSNKQNEFVKKIIFELFPTVKFGCIMGHTEGVPKKPDPTVPNLICKELGVKPQRCMLVGDSDVDIETSINASMIGVGVCWGYRSVKSLKEAGATYIANDPLDIINILKLYKKKRKSKSTVKKAEDVSEPVQLTTKTSTLKPTQTTGEMDTVLDNTDTTDIPLDNTASGGTAATVTAGEQMTITLDAPVTSETAISNETTVVSEAPAANETTATSETPLVSEAPAVSESTVESEAPVSEENK